MLVNEDLIYDGEEVVPGREKYWNGANTAYNTYEQVIDSIASRIDHLVYQLEEYSLGYNDISEEEANKLLSELQSISSKLSRI